MLLCIRRILFGTVYGNTTMRLCVNLCVGQSKEILDSFLSVSLLSDNFNYRIWKNIYLVWIRSFKISLDYGRASRWVIFLIISLYFSLNHFKLINIELLLLLNVSSKFAQLILKAHRWKEIFFAIKNPFVIEMHVQVYVI